MSGQTTQAERFTAWCMCPRCSRVDCHALRLPNPNATLTVDSGQQTITIKDFGGHVVREIKTGTEAADEAQYEVIRACRCGYQWGQI
ncbi:hypothetical protein IU414_06555 [Nocardia farcinica]|uniref:hypothetical protein n=1 Tax=Nocardia farcinica TaxID=37329 RepID=UPI001895C54C|nr:hypothetical protein [Nocardia farcinica]MBF6584420.1 hypothetical protein [Nocardia farcinica]